MIKKSKEREWQGQCPQGYAMAGMHRGAGKQEVKLTEEGNDQISGFLEARGSQKIQEGFFPPLPTPKLEHLAKEMCAVDSTAIAAQRRSSQGEGACTESMDKLMDVRVRRHTSIVPIYTQTYLCVLTLGPRTQNDSAN